MSVLNPSVVGESVAFDRNECESQGRAFHESYLSANPFPHIVLDEFLPRELLQRVLAEFPQREKGRFADDHSQLKTGYQLEMIKSQFITNLMAAFNSAQFVRFLEELSGIENLIVDPHYSGGGLHETARGGHLSIHVDFNGPSAVSDSAAHERDSLSERRLGRGIWGALGTVEQGHDRSCAPCAADDRTSGRV